MLRRLSTRTSGALTPSAWNVCDMKFDSFRAWVRDTETRTPEKEEREAKSHGAEWHPCLQGSRSIVAHRDPPPDRRRAPCHRAGRGRRRPLRERRPARGRRGNLELLARVARSQPRVAAS